METEKDALDEMRKNNDENYDNFKEAIG